MTRFEQSIFIITTLNGKMPRIRLVTRLLLDSHLFTQRHMYQKGVERLTTYWVSHIYSICWKIQTRINHTWGLRDGRCNSVSPGGGVSLYNGLYGKDPPERAPFLGLQMYERVGISLVEVYEMAGKSVISVCRKAKRANKCISWPWKSRENFFLQSSDRKRKVSLLTSRSVSI